MGQGRTLLRKGRADQTRRALPENRAAKRGTARRRVMDISETAWGCDASGAPISFVQVGHEADLHFTKGLRVRALHR
jgi:hypothetical protein